MNKRAFLLPVIISTLVLSNLGFSEKKKSFSDQLQVTHDYYEEGSVVNYSDEVLEVIRLLRAASEDQVVHYANKFAIYCFRHDCDGLETIAFLLIEGLEIYADVDSETRSFYYSKYNQFT